jgi:hypothetical protein
MTSFMLRLPSTLYYRSTPTGMFATTSNQSVSSATPLEGEKKRPFINYLFINDNLKYLLFCIMVQRICRLV